MSELSPLQKAEMQNFDHETFIAKLESDFAILRAENVRLHEELTEGMMLLQRWADDHIAGRRSSAPVPATARWLATVRGLLDFLPAVTQREVKRVRAMERVVEALKVLSGRLPPRDIVEQLADEKGLRPVPMVYPTTNEVRQVYEALAAYEQLVKEKP